MNPSGFHAIVQEWPVDVPHPVCRGFVDLPIARPTRVVIASDAFAGSERDLLIAELRSGLGRLAQQEHVCTGPGAFGCWATDEPAVRNLLVVVTSAGPPSLDIERLVGEWLGRGFEAIGVVQVDAKVDDVLPRDMRSLNALLWRTDSREVVPDLVDEVLLEGEDRRIFISYARQDGSNVADRVFNALERRRFDVFLDRFRLPPGADFMERIQDEILDKSMVVVVETEEALRSHWVRQEVSVAVARRLGLAAINIGPSGMVQEIDEGARCRIDDDDTIGSFIVEQHRQQLLERREALRESLYQALRDANVVPSEILDSPHGLVVNRAGRRSIVGISVRPADLHRFRLVEEQARGADLYIVHPQPWLPRRRQDIAWLSGVSNVIEVDEGRIDDVAAAIA